MNYNFPSDDFFNFGWTGPPQRPDLVIETLIHKTKQLEDRIALLEEDMDLIIDIKVKEIMNENKKKKTDR